MAKLGKVQLLIMKVLWESGPCTAREITDALNKIMEIAHSTVQTLLRKLEVKEVVAHELRDRTFYFRSLIEPEGVRKPATRELIDRMFEGSAGRLVSYLLRNESISGEELKNIQQLIDKTGTTKQNKKRNRTKKG